MRLVVEKWILTRTMDQQTNIATQSSEQQLDDTSNNLVRNNFVIEQTLHEEHMLYQKLNDSADLDQTDQSICETNDQDYNILNKEKNELSKIYLNINRQATDENQIIESPTSTKRNEIIVYLDDYNSAEAQQLNSSTFYYELKTNNNEQENDKHDYSILNTSPTSKINNITTETSPEVVSTTTLLLNTSKNKHHDISNNSKRNHKSKKRSNSWSKMYKNSHNLSSNNKRPSIITTNNNHTHNTVPIIYLEKSRSNSWSSSNEQQENSPNSKSNRLSLYDDYDDNETEYYYNHINKENLDSQYQSLTNSKISNSHNIENWHKFIDLLNKSLNLFVFREATILVEEFIKLETYLLNEFKSYEKEENDMTFQNRQEIVDFLNRNLQLNLFRLSQSTTLFDELKSKLKKLLKSNQNHLSVNNLNNLLNRFDCLERDYLKFFEIVKSKAKLKMAKYEKYVKTWNDFDLTCNHLESVFEKNSPGSTSMSSLNYRELIIDINSSLNKLKEQLNLLISIIDEKKYFELKNLIIFFELKFKKLQDDYEISFLNNTNTATPSAFNSNSITLKKINSKHVTSCETSRLVTNNYEEISSSISSYEEDSLIDDNEPFNVKLSKKTREDDETSPISTKKSNQNKENELLIKKKSNKKRKSATKLVKETSDKSTATVHEISTQTDKEKCNIGINTDELLQIDKGVRSKKFKAITPISTNNTNSPNKVVNKHLKDNANVVPKSSTSNNLPEYLNSQSNMEGKQLLLEAYLRNNENMLSAQQPASTSTASSSAAILTSKKISNNQASNTRESGIGTTNDDDECEEMESLHSMTHTHEYEENLTDPACYYEDRSSSLNNYDYPKNRNRNLKNKSNKTENLIESKLNKIDMKLKKEEDRLEKQLIHLKNDINYSTDGISYEKPKQSIKKAESPTTNSYSDFIKKLCTFLLFLFPLLFILIVYYVYNYYLNPSCCDFKRNYLLINIK